MNKQEIFDFIFQDKIDYLVDYIERNGMSSLLLNISHLGISGNYKRDLDPVRITELVVERGYAPMFAFEKKGSKYNIYYLWSNGPKGAQFDEIEAARKAMQSKSEWFFTVLNEFLPKPLIVIDTRSPRGYHVGDVNRVSDILPKIEWYKRHNEKEKGSIYIRVKKNTSSIGIFEIYKPTAQSVFRDLDKLGIKYQVI